MKLSDIVRRALIAVAALIFWGDASFAPAIAASAGESGNLTYRLLRLENQVARWQRPGSGPVVVTYAIANRRMDFDKARNCRTMTSPQAILDASRVADKTFRAELAAAFRQWEAIANIRFVAHGDPESADIVIGAQFRPVGRAFTNVELADAAQSLPRSIKRSLICLNPEQRWKVGFDGNLDVYDLRYTLAHEIGHAIGLDHPGSRRQLMDFRYTETFRAPQSGDVTGAVALYGPADGYRDTAARSDKPAFAHPRPLNASKGENASAGEFGIGTD